MGAPLPLEGLTVLDFTRVLTGPFATMLLGDMGADVVKVEPLGGDESRSWPPFLPRGESGYFTSLNRNKQSLTLNLKDPRGRELAQALARQADVVIENFTPGVAGRLGIDYATLADERPELIFCAVTGFGQDGPYRDKRAYDPIIQGMTGLMSITGERGRSPVKVGVPITDLVGALYAVAAIEAAYIHVLKGGSGQFIDIALYDSMLALLTIMATEYFAAGKAPERWGLDHIHRVPARAFEAGDGKYVQVAATNDVMYPKFCRVLGLEELVDDPRFATNALRVTHRDEIMPLLEARMRERTRDDWLERFEAAGLPCGPILDLAEVFADPNVAARKMCFDLDHPEEGPIRQLGFPFKFAATPARARLRPPLLGEHTREILAGRLNLTGERIDALAADGVI